MDNKKLLFVTKFEELGFDAVRSLLVLRKAALEHVVFITVIERDRVAMRRGTGYRKDEEIRLRETANIRFIDWAEDLFEKGLEVGVYIVVGNVVSEVIKASQKEEADLIVIGRSHKGILEHLYSGSDVIEILRQSSVPVLVYKHLSDNSLAVEEPFKRPLLAVDWSPASMQALEYLKTIQPTIEELHFVHVASEKELQSASAMQIQKTRKETRRKLDDLAEQFEAEGLRTDTHIHIGDPIEEIEKAARDCQASMIVLGSSGKSAWVERFLGSIPQYLAEKSIYPTLLIPMLKETQ